MAHTFDTGLSAPTRTLVRNAIVDALAPLLTTSGLYLRSIKPFAGTIGGAGDDEGIDRAYEVIGTQAPAILVSAGDVTYARTGNTGHQWQGELTVQVIALTNNARSLDARLAADVVAGASNTADPGLDVILEHAAQLLTGSNLGLGPKVKVLEPVSDQHLAFSTDRNLALGALTFRLSVSRDVLQYRTALAALAELAITWKGREQPSASDGHQFTQELP